MAAVMNTPSHARFDASFGAGGLRGPYLTPDPPSMVDQLPSIKFGFDDLRDRMARFTQRFDLFIDQGRKRVLEERNHFRINMSEIQESQRSRRRELEDMSNKSIAHQNTLEKEAQEHQEMQKQIQELDLQRQNHEAHRDDLRSQISSLQKSIHARRQAQHHHQRQLDNQARHNRPELQFWESHLCMRIEGLGVDDRIKFVYTHVDERDWDRQCAFELNMETKDYQVIAVEPALDDEAVDAVVERLNETRDLAAFLKAMRALFTATIRH
ncbi:kinetochore protein-like protein spc25 [Aureobasidium sp. EXF-3400]|nr:kinetochore protein-like protein spc25 [Aureobasidium sp. EXF-12344]KAI4782425.1 kinetochore protein-like protein spc25 [Aureobasidium sp. EXF-3400]